MLHSILEDLYIQLTNFPVGYLKLNISKTGFQIFFPNQLHLQPSPWESMATLPFHLFRPKTLESSKSWGPLSFMFHMQPSRKRSLYLQIYSEFYQLSTSLLLSGEPTPHHLCLDYGNSLPASTFVFFSFFALSSQ